MSISIDLRDFEKAFDDLKAGLQNGAHQALVSAVKAAHDSARTTDLFKDGPDAKLRNSIVMAITGSLSGSVSAGGRAASYARFVENGTPPHDIKPKKAGALRFVLNGEVVFRRIVHHPGTAERPFMARAAAVGEQTLDYGMEYFSERPIAHFNAG
jgi:HK97 gp10 family phage protein